MNHLADMANKYKGRKVLVTGCNGFKGSWLTLWLHNLGAKTQGIGFTKPSEPCLFDSIDLASLINMECLDIRDYGRLKEVILKFKPEILFHLAAQPIVRQSYEQPLETLQINIMGSANLLEACRYCDSIRSVVMITSDKCYRNNEWVWGYRENDPMGGHDPYSASKGCAELVIASYIKSFFAPEKYGKDHQTAIASARAGNAIGGGDWGRDRLLPDCFRALSKGEPIEIRYPNAVRPWQHVLECLSGYLQLGIALLEYGPKYGCGWNFAPIDMGDVWTVERVVKRICEIWGNGQFKIKESAQPHEANMLCLDCTKANIELGWRPRYKVEEALEATAVWYKELFDNPAPTHMREFTSRQIQNYVSLLNKE